MLDAARIHPRHDVDEDEPGKGRGPALLGRAAEREQRRDAAERGPDRDRRRPMLPAIRPATAAASAA